MTHHVFISHSSKDKAIADAVCASLEAAKIRCWIAPRDIMAGEKWAESIETAITSSRIMVLIFSSHSNNSEAAKSEVSMAFSSKVIVIPFRIENIEPTGEMKFYLMRTHWLDAVNPPTKEQIQKLVETTSILMKSESPGSADISEVERQRKENEGIERLHKQREEKKRLEKEEQKRREEDRTPMEREAKSSGRRKWLFAIIIILGILALGWYGSSTISTPQKNASSVNIIPLMTSKSSEASPVTPSAVNLTQVTPVDFKVWEKEGLDVSGKGIHEYYIVDWQGEKWIAIKGKPNKLAKLVMEMRIEDRKTIMTGETWSLGSGYELTIDNISAKTSPKQVWFTLKKDGTVIDKGIGQAPQSSADKEKAVYYRTKTILGESDVLFFTIYVYNIFSGATTDAVQFKYAWLIDDTTAKEIK
jgi:hypothetical protein